MSESTSDTVNSAQYQYNHRGRAIRSCLECRRRKMRCSRSQPCQNCSRFSRACVYYPYPDWSSNSMPRQRDGSFSGPAIEHEDNALLDSENNPCEYHGQSQSVGESQSDVQSSFQMEPDWSCAVDPEELLNNDIVIGRLKVSKGVGRSFWPQLARRVSHTQLTIEISLLRCPCLHIKDCQQLTEGYFRLQGP